jgi:hypothetical protein
VAEYRLLAPISRGSARDDEATLIRVAVRLKPCRLRFFVPPVAPFGKSLLVVGGR